MTRPANGPLVSGIAPASRRLSSSACWSGWLGVAISSRPSPAARPSAETTPRVDPAPELRCSKTARPRETRYCLRAAADFILKDEYALFEAAAARKQYLVSLGRAVFEHLSSGAGSTRGVVSALGRGFEERVLVFQDEV